MRAILKLTVIYSFLFISFTNAQVEKIRVACVGNSITEGAGWGSQTYPAQLGALLGSHYDVKNYGLGGRTLLKKGDFPYWVENKFWEAKDFNPHIVIIKLGTNDSKPQNWIYKNDFFSDYMEFVSEFRKDGRNPQIFVCRPCPVFQDNWGITNSIIRDEIMPLIDSVVMSANTYMIDFNAAMIDQSNLFPDGIHPNGTGYGIMATVAQQAILNSPAGIIRYFNSVPTTFEKGESVKLYWETTTGSQVSIHGTAVSSSDSMNVNPAGSTNYSLITAGAAADTLEIVVDYLPPGKIKSFYAKPPILELNGGESTYLHWSSSAGSVVTLDGKAVELNDSMIVSPDKTTEYILKSSGDANDSSIVTVTLLEADKINRALMYNGIKTSSTARDYLSSWAFDADTNTAWKSSAGKAQWIMVDLGKTIYINRVVLKWGNVYGITYHLETLSETGTPARIYSTTSGDGNIDDLSILNNAARQIRLLCINSNLTDSGYILKEFEVYGTSKPTSINYDKKNVPVKYNLEQNFPNPFNPGTVIRFSLPKASHVQLKLYNVLGQEVKTILNEFRDAGEYQINFTGEGLNSGVYYYKIISENYTATRKMILIK